MIKKRSKSYGKMSKGFMHLNEYKIVIWVIWYVHAENYMIWFKNEIIKMSIFKFGKIEVASKYFYK